MWGHLGHLDDRILTRVLDAELTGRRQAAATRHLAKCPGCAARLRSLASASDAVRDALHHDDSVSTGVTRLRDRVRSRVLEAAATTEPRALATMPASGFLAFAALAAGVVAVVWLVGPVERQARRIPDALEARSWSDALPDSSLTPGAVRRASASELCAPGRLAERTVDAAVRGIVLRAYGMEHVPATEYELDFLITPELGGAGDRENLWPERYGSRVWNARVKDELERLLPQLVCAGRLDLTTAQRDIATDWIAAYKKYFHATVPLTPTADAFDDDPVERAAPSLVALAQLARR